MGVQSVGTGICNIIKEFAPTPNGTRHVNRNLELGEIIPALPGLVTLLQRLEARYRITLADAVTERIGEGTITIKELAAAVVQAMEQAVEVPS